MLSAWCIPRSVLPGIARTFTCQQTQIDQYIEDGVFLHGKPSVALSSGSFVFRKLILDRRFERHIGSIGGEWCIPWGRPGLTGRAQGQGKACSTRIVMRHSSQSLHPLSRRPSGSDDRCVSSRLAQLKICVITWCI